jgi:hypothetical protein
MDEDASMCLAPAPELISTLSGLACSATGTVTVSTSVVVARLDALDVEPFAEEELAAEIALRALRSQRNGSVRMSMAEPPGGLLLCVAFIGYEYRRPPILTTGDSGFIPFSR